MESLSLVGDAWIGDNGSRLLAPLSSRLGEQLLDEMRGILHLSLVSEEPDRIETVTVTRHPRHLFV